MFLSSFPGVKRVDQPSLLTSFHTKRSRTTCQPNSFLKHHETDISPVFESSLPSSKRKSLLQSFPSPPAHRLYLTILGACRSSVLTLHLTELPTQRSRITLLISSTSHHGLPVSTQNLDLSRYLTPISLSLPAM